MKNEDACAGTETLTEFPMLTRRCFLLWLLSRFGSGSWLWLWLAGFLALLLSAICLSVYLSACLPAVCLFCYFPHLILVLSHLTLLLSYSHPYPYYSARHQAHPPLSQTPGFVDQPQSKGKEAEAPAWFSPFFFFFFFLNK